MPGPLVAMAGASVVGGLAQASSARSAANAQTRAANDQIGLQREIYQDQTERFAPFLGGGTNALNAYLYEMGLGPAPMMGGSAPQVTEFRETVPGSPGQYQFRGEDQFDTANMAGYYNAMGQRVGLNNPAADTFRTRFRVGDQVFDDRAAADAFAAANPAGGQAWGGLSMSPAAQFALQQGRDTVEAGAAARGGLNSGATLAGLERLRMGMAAQDRDNQLNRLAGLADMGQGAAGMQAQAGNAFAAQASNALAQRGNAQSAGAIGVGNAFGGMMNNLSGVAGYQMMANQPQAQQPRQWWNPGQWG
jgi:hypothetical protein